MNTALRPAFEIQADTNVYPDKDGYMRTMLMSTRNDDHTRTLIQIEMRVDRQPGASFFTGHVWTDHGWEKIIDPNSVLYWYSMPGYERWNKQSTDAKTRRLAFKLAEQVIEAL